MPSIEVALGDSKLGRFNPAAKLLAATAVMAGLLLTADVVSAAVVLSAELVALVAFEVPFGILIRRTWPLGLAAVGVAFANVVGGTDSSETIAAVSLRLLAIALPGVLVFASTDSVDLADSLVQQLRVPPRYAYGSLAALRLLPQLSADWNLIRRARRARGIDAGRSPWRVVRLFASAVFALLVAAIRRGTRLAAAMDSRGFDSRLPRSAARCQRVNTADRVLVAGAVAITLVANLLAAAAGLWHPLLG